MTMADEIGWLIESQRDRPMWLSLSKSVLGYWTSDSVRATRFARRIDAEDWLESQESIDPKKVTITEHIWSDNHESDDSQIKRLVTIGELTLALSRLGVSPPTALSMTKRREWYHGAKARLLDVSFQINPWATARNGRHYHSLEHAWSEGWRACDAAVSKMDAGRLASGGTPDSPVDGG